MRLERARQNVEMNWVPRSEMIDSGTPWSVYTRSINLSANSSASKVSVAIKCLILVNRSTTTSTCLNSLPKRGQGGRGET